MSKKAKKTNRSDTNIQMEILKTLLVLPQSSIYKLNKSIKDSTFSTVRRNIYKLKNDGLIKIGEPEKRKAMSIILTLKGLATVLIDGNLTKEELIIADRITLKKNNPKLSQEIFSIIEPYFSDISCDTLLELKPKVNLKYFDEKYFRKIYLDSTFKAIENAIEKYHIKFEKEGIWATETERQEAGKKFWDDFLKELKEESKEE